MQTDWTRVPDGELDKARQMRDDGFVELVFRIDGWWVREKHPPASPHEDLDVREAVEKANVVRPVIKPFERTADGRYVTNYEQCPCGEQFLIRSHHQKNSLRHKQWLRGDIEVPVPEQPLMVAFDRNQRPPLELGATLLCPRCKSRHRKGFETLDYYEDPRCAKDNPKPCLRCNGHGIVPNVGL